MGNLPNKISWTFIFESLNEIWANFVSHIIGTVPTLEMARAYGLRPRLWLLNTCI